MTFNIEWGGEHVSFDAVVEAIRLSEADVVGIQEAEGNLERLAGMLGWHYDRRNYVVSRHPLLDPPGADGRYVFVEVTPGHVIAVSNLHLPSDPYGPDLVRDGADPAEVLANEEQVRMPALRPYLETLPGLVERGMPVIVTGDFNSPAHTDWTERMIGKRRFLDYPVAWPVTVAMQDAGFKDTWRAIFPDPETHPGLTWWARRPPLEAYAPGENDAEDRIDYLWYAGPLAPGSAFIAGEAGGPEVSVRVSPWPSDHRAVYADFVVTPLPMPNLVTTDRRVYVQGGHVRIFGRFDPAGASTVTVVDADSGEKIMDEVVDTVVAEWLLPTPVPGEYRVTASIDSVTLERTFWVLPAGAAPTLEVRQNGRSASLHWRNAPGNRNDYIALYDVDESDLVDGMLGFAYIDARPHGEIDIRRLQGVQGRMPESRTCIARLMKDDGYQVLAETAPFGDCRVAVLN